MTTPLAPYCPGCAAPLPENEARTALSRYDNATRICSACGEKEGLAQFAAHARGEEPRAALVGPGQLRGEESA
jgi:hypothetical protein